MIDRYAKQRLFAHIGEKGQERIRESVVLLVGCGALGSVAAEMLTRAGIGKLILFDRDYVEWTNLHRQSLFCEYDAKQGLPKVIAAKNRLAEINEEVVVEGHLCDGDAHSLAAYVQQADVVIDATDNFETRLILNDLAIQYEKPWIYGACVGSQGMSFTIRPQLTPCFHCLIHEVPLEPISCESAGVIGPVVHQVVSYQVTEVMKLIVQDYSALREGIVTFNLWTNHFHHFHVSRLKNPLCVSCGLNRTYPFLFDLHAIQAEVLCGRDAVHIKPLEKISKSLDDYLLKIPRECVTLKNQYLLIAEIDTCRIVFFRDGRAIIHGIHSVEKAKTIYQKWFGG